MNWALRAARKEDARALWALAAEVRWAPQWSADVWTAVVESDLRRVWVAEREEGLLGFVVVSIIHDIAEVESIAVSTAAQRAGIGKALLDHACAACEAAGCRLIELEVRASNVVAQTFYARQGFLVQGTRRNYYEAPPEDAVLMSRSLDDRAHGKNSL